MAAPFEKLNFLLWFSQDTPAMIIHTLGSFEMCLLAHLAALSDLADPLEQNGVDVWPEPQTCRFHHFFFLSVCIRSLMGTVLPLNPQLEHSLYSSGLWHLLGKICRKVSKWICKVLPFSFRVFISFWCSKKKKNPLKMNATLFLKIRMFKII